MVHRKIVPYTVPALREEPMSPAPTPVAAMIRPGPTSRSRLPKVLGASVSAGRPPATSAIGPLPLSFPRYIRHYPRPEHNGPTTQGSCPSAADPGLLEVEVALDAAHDLGVDLPAVAQREYGLTLGPDQLAPPVAPGGGALRVLLGGAARLDACLVAPDAPDRKSTRLNSSHANISYAV